MTLEPTPALLQSLYWITLIAVIVSSASAVLKAGFKKFDLFGVIMIAVVTGLGGGSLRDMLLEREVFWIYDQVFFIASLLSAVVIFITARLVAISPRFFLIPDAAGLATFGIAGTLVSLLVGAPWLVASFMGVITGVAGGIIRDTMCNEIPIVFKSTLYATISLFGGLVFIALIRLGLDIVLAASTAGILIFLVRLAAIKWGLSLPVFNARE